MSEKETPVIVVEENKSGDKKEIEHEEREKMLKGDKEVSEVLVVGEAGAEPQAPEGREVKPKFIPIGGIKMPGFFTRAKPKPKGQTAVEDGAGGELLEKGAGEGEGGAVPPAEAAAPAGDRVTLRQRLANLNIHNPFTSKQRTHTQDNQEQTDKPDKVQEAERPRESVLVALRRPLARLGARLGELRGTPRAPADAEAGLRPAGLASAETLDDKEDKTPQTEMETVKLDAEDKADGAAAEGADGAPEGGAAPAEKLPWRERLRRQQFIIDDWAVLGGVLLFLLLLIIIIAVTASGGGLKEAPLKDGRYVDAVTSCGLTEGVLEDGAFTFRGIPYAVPPLGELRWRAARPLDNLKVCWNGTLQAHNATARCMQLLPDGSIEGSEDCLTLDVVTPHVRYDNPLPVIVLIGAETLTGGAVGPLRPSARYARARDVVFVRPDFRLGVLGFLALDELAADVHPPTSGNYGLSDIVIALKWVQLNIKNFGGDPAAVTLVGHRAGATLAGALATAPGAHKLFKRVWLSSGSAIAPANLTETQKAGKLFLSLRGCQSAECLRKLPAEELLKTVPDTWRPDFPDLPTKLTTKQHDWLVMDGKILRPRSDIENASTHVPVPLVIGTARHAAASEKLFLRHSNWSSELVRKHVEDSQLGQAGLTEEIFRLYNATYEGLAAMVSDIHTVCPLRALARQRDAPFYLVTQERGERSLADADADIAAILGRYEPKTPEQRRYMSAMQGLFYYFVSHGEVGSAAGVPRPVLLEVGQDVLPKPNLSTCDFWSDKSVVPNLINTE